MTVVNIIKYGGKMSEQVSALTEGKSGDTSYYVSNITVGGRRLMFSMIKEKYYVNRIVLSITDRPLFFYCLFEFILP